MQSAIQTWKTKLEQEDVNYDEILMYASCHTELQRLCEVLRSSTLIMDFQEVEGFKNSFLTNFELLNMCLIKYIPNHPDAKWCSFLALLKEYGVSLPQQLLTKIEKYIIFPNDTSKTADDLLKHPIPSATSGLFQPGSDISLRLSRDFSLKELSALITGIQEFQDPLLVYLDMLVFFKLNHSVMFDKYLRAEIEQATDKEKERIKEVSHFAMPSTGLSMFKFSAPSIHTMLQPGKPKSHGGVSVTILQDSLEKTKQLLTRIMRGEAAYFEIIANGKLDLEKLDIEEEFSTLSIYAVTTSSQSGSEGLAGVRSLLELFQYTKHIQNIYEVCDQYQLQGCLKDEELEEVQSLVADVKLDDNRSKLTPNVAKERMERIKQLLCIVRVEDTHSENKELLKRRSACLEVFPIVTNSAEFYQFIRDKHFYGEKGQATFRQQYQLITAQLQHEEYDESVLNHLLAAFKVMIPFMNQKQTFRELMTKVTGNDTTLGLKQLETVNANITTIRLWFSRAEVCFIGYYIPAYIHI